MFADLTIPGGIDATNAIFKIGIKTESKAAIGSIWADIGDMTMANFVRVDVVKDLRYLDDGQYRYVTFSLSSKRSTTGTPNMKDARKIRIRVTKL